VETLFTDLIVDEFLTWLKAHSTHELAAQQVHARVHSENVPDPPALSRKALRSCLHFVHAFCLQAQARTQTDLFPPDDDKLIRMPVVSVRVSKELKERMDKLDQDWPSYLRQMIERKTRERQVSRASRAIDQIRLKTRKGQYDAARSVRQDRDEG